MKLVTRFAGSFAPHFYSLKAILQDIPYSFSLVLFGGAFLIFFIGIIYYQIVDTDTDLFGPNISVILFINCSVVIIGLLAFLVARHVVKLVFDRKRRTFGSKLRLKLVLAFGSLTLIPTVLLFVFASGLLNQAIEGWLSNQSETSKTAAITLATGYYSQVQATAEKEVRGIAQEITRSLSTKSKELELFSLIERERRGRGLYTLAVLKPDGGPITVSATAISSIESFQEPSFDDTAIERATRGRTSSLRRTSDSGSFVQFYHPLSWRGVPSVLIGSLRIDPEIARSIAMINQSVQEYHQLMLFKNPLKSGYIMTLTMITGLILFSVIWLAFYISKQIVGPVELLARGTQAVARGEYTQLLQDKGDDELGFLVQSFNMMVRDLRASEDESTQRRLFIENVLSALAVGVVTVNRLGIVTNANRAAEKLLSADPCREVPLSSWLKSHIIEALEPLSLKLESADVDEVDGQFQTLSQGRGLTILCTLGKMLDEKNEWIATLYLFDDITDLLQAQQMAAWREVARRIAHEIKNPLTPIQLSAQRIARNFNTYPEIVEGCDTIVENVDSIKRLANDFSRFARMPTVELSKVDLNALIFEVIDSYSEQYPTVTFQFIAFQNLTDVECDRDQIRRVVVNLLDNAALALQHFTPSTNSNKGDSRPRPRTVTIKTNHDRRRRMVTIEVIDTGPGIRSEHKHRIFEPYFTLRQGGSGLGLTIVNSILSDHQGQIRVYDNHPQGARFVVELPIEQKESTQRKLGER
jgi:two-component system, NtrC family, nitrogen regulation sensor histidine kinase NtrY